MAHHPRYQRSLDELVLRVYVYIDDWLEPYQAQLPKHCKQKASVSELLNIADRRGSTGHLHPYRAWRDLTTPLYALMHWNSAHTGELPEAQARYDDGSAADASPTNLAQDQGGRQVSRRSEPSAQLTVTSC